MPVFVVPGLVALVVGLALLGWTILRSGILPKWLGAVLLFSAVLMLGTNEQTARVLLAAPFGLVWAAAGLALLPRHASPRPRHAAGRAA